MRHRRKSPPDKEAHERGTGNKVSVYTPKIMQRNTNTAAYLRAHDISWIGRVAH